MVWIGYILGAVGVLASVVAAVFVGRSKAKDETIDAQQSTIDAMGRRIDLLDAQRIEDERRCAEKIAELKGRVDTLEHQQTDVMTAALAPRIVSGLVDALDRGEWGPG